MRVLAIGNVYPPHHLGGYELIWRGVVQQLRGDGHETRVLTTDYRRPEAAPGVLEEADVQRELRWYWHDHQWPRMSPMQRLRLERHNAATFDRNLARFRPDVIMWWPVGGMSLGLIERARRAGIPGVFFVLDYWPRYGPRHDLWLRMWSRHSRAAAVAERITGLPTRLDLASAGRWVFCSQATLEDTLQTGLRIADPVILPPGIERSYAVALREHEPPEWRWRLLYIGRVVEQKGVRTAIEALALLPDEAGLVILGEGDEPYRRELEGLALALGVADRVEFKPPRPREELPDVYRASDMVGFPVQWAEPWGLVPLEAMALGRLVVATGTGGSGDFLVDRQNSLLFKPGEAAALAEAVKALAGDPNLRAQLRAGGFETAAQHTEDEFNRRAIEELQVTLQRPPADGARRC
jgi:glycosyltransferase involved in cell wall biosynthesis